MSNNKLRAIGIMSGTSLDGIDVSYVSSDGKSRFTHNCSSLFKFRESTSKSLHNLVNNFTKNKNSISNISDCENLVSEDYVNAIRKFIKSKNIKKVDLIALHGQTIFHSSKNKSSIQLCNSSYIAEKTNKTIVTDFRQDDLLNGGEGAPLVPIFHKLLINKLKIKKPCSFINIGGISNISILNNRGKLTAYDIGPGMCLLDQFVFFKKKQSYDNNGVYSSKGKINKNILRQLLNDKFFKKIPPKSLDRNHFSFNSVLKMNFYDACATLSAFTAYAIINNLKKIDNQKIILSGGGVKNKFILNLIKKNLGNRVISIDEIYGDAKFIESQAFAYLGIRRVKNLPISFPGTTGVKNPITGGKITKLSIF
jgi:anhydro-N-acetylmuramic acid kinase